ncbi:MAG: protein TonB [Glaciecola sp.]|jgi:protein TonB
MSSHRPGPPSHYWAKPIGLSVSVHLAVFVAIPTLLGLGAFALSRGEAQKPPAVHELRFEMVQGRLPEAEISKPLDTTEPIPTPVEEWPQSEDALDGGLPEIADKAPEPESAEERSQDARAKEALEAPQPDPEPTEPKQELLPEADPPVEPPVEPEVEPEPKSDQEPTEPAASPAPANWSPQLLTEFCPEPRYPSKARRRQQEGAVVLRLTVDKSGSVVLVEVVESSGHAILDRTAKKMLATWRFRPAPNGWLGGSKQVRRRILFRLPR